MAERLKNEPSALWVQVLKGLYFSRGNFLTASKGARASWGWSSMLQGRDVLVKEGLWIVGDGQQIRTYEDRWIPSKPNMCLEYRTQEESGVICRVADWIKEDRTWDVMRVGDEADTSDVEHILQITIPVDPTPDKLLWPHTADGVTSAKSAYHIIRGGLEEASTQAGRYTDQTTARWRSIWRANVLPKTKGFIWRMLTNSLAVRWNLHRRRMDVPLQCPLCECVEDIEHVVFKCRWTRAVWFGILGLSNGHQNRATIAEWMEDRRNEQVLSKEHKEERWELCLWTCWLIWRSRCKAVFEQRKPCPKTVIDEARKLQMEHKQLKQWNSRQTKNVAQHTWTRPGREEITINADAAWCQRTQAGGIGVVARNADGMLLDGANQSCRGDNVNEMEARAVMLGIDLAKNSGWRNITILSDSITVIDHLSGRNFNWRLKHICENILSVATDLGLIKWKAIPRTMNECANWVAVQTRLGVCPSDWVQRPLLLLSNLLRNDCILFDGNFDDV